MPGVKMYGGGAWHEYEGGLVGKELKQRKESSSRGTNKASEEGSANEAE